MIEEPRSGQQGALHHYDVHVKEVEGLCHRSSVTAVEFHVNPVQFFPHLMEGLGKAFFEPVVFQQTDPRERLSK